MQQPFFIARWQNLCRKNNLSSHAGIRPAVPRAVSQQAAPPHMPQAVLPRGRPGFSPRSSMPYSWAWACLCPHRETAGRQRAPYASISPVAGALVPNAGPVAVILNSAFLLKRRRKLPLEEGSQTTLLS